ncbi:MAG: helix-turn-helix domain-containing protein [Verrucomicrobiales bacterium]|nr:helix-turn-helix domain-containing protein [Verrucomicrobiales bacterium]
MAQTIGETLRKKREQLGWTIEDVAHETRIHANTIRGLETDDYSVFASTTYAKSFLQLYSRHLEVDAEDALNDFGAVARQLNESSRVTLAPTSSRIEPGEAIRSHQSFSHNTGPAYDKKNNQPFPVFLGVAVLLLILIIPTFYFIGKKAKSLEEATTILKDTLSTETVIPTDEEKEEPPSDKADEQSVINIHRFPRPLHESQNTQLPTVKATPQKSAATKATPVTDE